MLATAHVEGGEYLGIVDTVRHTQLAQHGGELAVGAKGQHVDGAGAHLSATEGLGGEAATRVGKTLDHRDTLAPLEELGGAEQATQSRADDDYVDVSLAHVMRG